MLIYNRIGLEKLFSPRFPIDNFVFNASINSLPTLRIIRPVFSLLSEQYNKKELSVFTAIQEEDTVRHFYLTYSTVLYIDDNPPTGYSDSILSYIEFNLKRKDSDNSLEYVMFDRLNKVICGKTMTLCNTTLAEVLDYYYYNLNLPSGFIGFSWDYNIPFGRIDLDNTTLIDFLNSLEEYGLYWFVNYTNGSIVVKNYTNFTSDGNLIIIGDYNMSIEKQEFQGIKIIKEAAGNPIDTEMSFDIQGSTNGQNITAVITGNCPSRAYFFEEMINLNVPVKPYLYNFDFQVLESDCSGFTYYSYIVAFVNTKDRKIYIKELYSNSNFCSDCENHIYTVKLNNVVYYLVYRGKDTYGNCVDKCAGANCYNICPGGGNACYGNVCKVYDEIANVEHKNCPNDSVGDYLGTQYDCYDSIYIGMVRSCNGKVRFKLTVNPGDLSTGLCLTNPEDANCILTGDYLTQYETYLGNTTYKNCAVEKRFSNIPNSVIDALIKPYYLTMLANPDRLVIQGNIYSSTIPQVGLRYDVKVGERTINSMLLRSIDISPEGMRGELVWPF